MVQKVEEMPMEKRPKWAVAALDHTSSFPNIAILLKLDSVSVPRASLKILKCTIIFILQLITWRHVTAFAGFYLKMDEWTKRWNRLLSTPPKLFGFARISYVGRPGRRWGSGPLDPPPSAPWNNPNPVFKVTPFFNADYLRRVKIGLRP